MKKYQFSNIFYRYYNNLYRIVLYLVTVATIVYSIPKRIQFEYEVQQGQLWLDEDIFAPFDFAIKKTDEELDKERKTILSQMSPVFDVDTTIAIEVTTAVREQLMAAYKTRDINWKTFDKARKIISTLYESGIYTDNEATRELDPNASILINKNNVLSKSSKKNITQISKVENLLDLELSEATRNKKYKKAVVAIFFNHIKPNIFYNQTQTEKLEKEQIANIIPHHGLVNKGMRIISKGERVQGESYQKLISLRDYVEASSTTSVVQASVTLGQALIIGLLLFILIQYLLIFRHTEFSDNSQLTFVVLNILVGFMMVKMTLSLGTQYINIVPLCIIPFVIKGFFDFRLAVITLLITVLICSFIAPNATEFIIFHLVGGLTVVISSKDFYKRVNLFLSVLKIVFTYCLIFIGFKLTYGKALTTEILSEIWLFLINGMLCLFVLPLIYIYEKVFRITSDVSLLEWADTNNPLMRDLSNYAPGTFQHSLQVANLAEAVCLQIGGQVLLARTGALYHDIGKLEQPEFFTENQDGTYNPHDELTPIESAHIITNHVTYGIELAKKNRLPDSLIDFIRTHHGTSTVYYFLKKDQELQKENPDHQHRPDEFKYKGILPFSKETAVVMMCDSVEAASRSLTSPTEEELTTLINKIVDNQLANGQMQNADISLKEIEIAKRVLITRTLQTNHHRIRYPD